MIDFSSPGDNGTLTFWDYDSGTAFQHLDDVPQPGSLEAEAGVFCSTFDMTGTRLITGGADKTIKVGLPSHLVLSSLTIISPDICRAVTMIVICPICSHRVSLLRRVLPNTCKLVVPNN